MSDFSLPPKKVSTEQADLQGVGRLEFSELVLLVDRARDRDREAFEKLMHEHSGFVYSIAFGMLGGRPDAEAIFQETFLRAWSKLPFLRRGGSFTYWIKRIATNLSIDRLKARERQLAYAESQHLETSMSLATETQPKDEGGMVRSLLPEVPPMHRAPSLRLSGSMGPRESNLRHN